jgi:hypothetical protein
MVGSMEPPRGERLKPSDYLDVAMTPEQQTILDPTLEDLMLREILKDCGGDGAVKKLAQRKLDSTGFVNAFSNEANSEHRIQRLLQSAKLAASMAAIARAQVNDKKAKEADDEDALVVVAPVALKKVWSNNQEQLGMVEWFKKLTVKEMRALNYAYYKVNTPVMLKQKVVEALVALYLKYPERLTKALKDLPIVG